MRNEVVNKILNDLDQVGYLYMFDGKKITLYKSIYYTPTQLDAIEHNQPVPYTLGVAKYSMVDEGPEKYWLKPKERDLISRGGHDSARWAVYDNACGIMFDGWINYLYELEYYKEMPVYFTLKRDDEKARQLFNEWNIQETEELTEKLNKCTEYAKALNSEITFVADYI